MRAVRGECCGQGQATGACARAESPAGRGCVERAGGRGGAGEGEAENKNQPPLSLCLTLSVVRVQW